MDTSLNFTLRIENQVTDNYCFTSLRINSKPKWIRGRGCPTFYSKFSNYSADYVNKLYNMVRRQSNAPFFCFTDDSDGIDSNIIVIKIDVSQYLYWNNWWPAWCKILLYNRKELDQFYKKIFFDLDTIIHGDITPIIEHDDNFSLVYSKWRGLPYKMQNPHKSMYNSSCIVWKNNKSIYDYWMKNPRGYVERYMGTDDFYHSEKIKRTALPQIFYSNRQGCSTNQDNSLIMRDDHAVALLHQEPKNHILNIEEHPILEYWK